MKLAVQCSRDYTAPRRPGSTGVQPDAPYLLELVAIAQGPKHGEVFRCEKRESSEIW